MHTRVETVSGNFRDVSTEPHQFSAWMTEAGKLVAVGRVAYVVCELLDGREIAFNAWHVASWEVVLDEGDPPL